MGHETRSLMDRKSNKTEAHVVGALYIDSFFKVEDSSADIPVAAAVVENADMWTTEEEEANVIPVCPNALKTF